MKPKYIIIVLLFFLASCNWEEWLESPGKPHPDFFIPDSLKFQFSTGDTMIFRSLSNDTAVYDTFYVTKDSSFEAYFEGNPPPIASYQVISLIYKNDKKTIQLSETSNVIVWGVASNGIHIAMLDSICTCYYCPNCMYNGELQDEVNIYGLPYQSVFYWDSVGRYTSIYANTTYGLISYTDSLTYSIFKYLPTN